MEALERAVDAREEALEAARAQAQQAQRAEERAEEGQGSGGSPRAGAGARRAKGRRPRGRRRGRAWEAEVVHAVDATAGAYEGLARLARLLGELQKAESALQRAAELRTEQLEAYEEGSADLQACATPMLQLAATLHALGTCIRVQVAKPGVVYREADRIRRKADKYTAENFVLYNGAEVQDNIKSLLGARVARAEDMLVRALTLRRAVLQTALETHHLATETTYSQDPEILGLKELVAQSLSSLAILQEAYGLPTAQETHEEALSIYASKLYVDAREGVEFDAVRGDWVHRRHMPKQFSSNRVLRLAKRGSSGSGSSARRRTDMNHLHSPLSASGQVPGSMHRVSPLALAQPGSTHEYSEVAITADEDDDDHEASSAVVPGTSSTYRRVARTVGCMFGRSSRASRSPPHPSDATSSFMRSLPDAAHKGAEALMQKRPSFESMGDEASSVEHGMVGYYFGAGPRSAVSYVGRGETWRLVLAERTFSDWYARQETRAQSRLATLNVSSEVILDARRAREIQLGSGVSNPAQGVNSEGLEKLALAHKSPFLERAHASLRFDEQVGRWRIHDASGRKGGILVNGVRVRDVFLEEGDSVSFGGLATSVKHGETVRSSLLGSDEGGASPTPLVFRCERVWQSSRRHKRDGRKRGVPALSIVDDASADEASYSQGEDDLDDDESDFYDGGVTPNAVIPKLAPPGIFVDARGDPAFMHFYALVVCEYLRQSCKISSGSPRSLLGVGVSVREGRAMYKELLRQGIPIHYWAVWVEARIKFDLMDEFMHFHRRREFNYFGV